MSLERREEHALERIAADIHRLVHFLLHKAVAQSAVLFILDSKGNRIMPATLAVGKTATAVLHEFVGPNGTGQELPPVGPVVYSTSDATIATVDPASGLITAVAAGTATITGTDGGNKLAASDTVSDTPPPPPVATSATLVITPN